jgi:hypothetical protein
MNWMSSAILGPSKKEMVDTYSAECRRLGSGAIMTIRYSPESAILTAIECCVYAFAPYSTWGSPHSDFEEVRVQMAKIIAATERLQENLLLATSEQAADMLLSASGCAIRQCQIEELLKAHLNEEETQGSEIHPASQRQHVTPVGKADDECKQSSVMLADCLVYIVLTYRKSAAVCKMMREVLSAGQARVGFLSGNL